MKRVELLALLGLVCGRAVLAQVEKPGDEFSRKNEFTVFAEYSPTSSHILMGGTRDRVLVNLGGGYSRRVARFAGMQLNYHVEVRPVLFESDPLGRAHETLTFHNPTGDQTFTGDDTSTTYTKCVPNVQTFHFPATQNSPATDETIETKCGRRWTFGQAFSPLGFKWSGRVHHAVQPFFVGTLGYMYTSRPVPVETAEAFNFLFNFGPGIEVFRRGKRSVALEYRYSHFSNRDTAPSNPGTDNMVFRLTYGFGR